MGIALPIEARVGKVGEEWRRYNVCDINGGELMNFKRIPEEFEVVVSVFGFVYIVANLPR